ncbi:SOS response-associated peptidase family protein [Arsukibacterium perlucidum]|uniref:SOS response-associated peptidase family protein n=1 Tax=Arsukibacterium perlucidum TaxID=368811 RepID=UPI00036AB1C6|nr:SOS response-associated peptidase family protein [Arsukibacterium perlucidum]
MCGRLNVIDDPGVIELCEGLQIQLFPEHQIFGRFIRATNPVSIVRQKDGVRRMDNAIWWLLLEPSATGFKPSKYTSFNTRYDKLNVKGSAGYQAFRHSRCVIPVKGFGETEYVNGKPIHYHDMVAKDGAMLLGGLCREWINTDTGELALSFSVITLPPHPKLMAVHTKASPLMLPIDMQLIDSWLNELVTDPSIFEPLLQPRIPYDLIAQQIDKPSTYQASSEIFTIYADN